MAHPVRLRLIELLAPGPSTASRLARQMDESSGTTSYHLRMLARAGAIEDVPGLGTARERWWRRRDPVVVIPTDEDVEGRAISARMFGIYFARDAEARQRFMASQDALEPEWIRGAFIGNWFVELTAEDATELGLEILALADRYRRRSPPPGSRRAIVSASILPWLVAG